MNITEERHLTVNTTSFQIRVGKALTVVDFMSMTGKSTGRDITIKNDTELDGLIKGLQVAKEFIEKLKTTPNVIELPKE
jgi:hypothetical protein